MRKKSYKGISTFRLVLFLVLILAGLLGIVGRLIYVQIIKAEKYQKLAESQHLEELKIEAKRGTIFSADGEKLAISIDVDSIFATPAYIKDPATVASQLAPLLKIDKDTLYRKLTAKAGFVYLIRKIDRDLSKRIQDMNIDGIGFLKESKRYYPDNNLAAQVIGFAGMDNQGLSGLELQYEKTLKGKDAEIITEKDAKGMPIPWKVSPRTKVINGSDIILTIDKDIQFKAESELKNMLENTRAKSGAVIVMRPENGDILAMACAPSFNLNEFEKADKKLWRNLTVSDLYEPGSTFKLVPISGALEGKIVSPATLFNLPYKAQVGGEAFGELDGSAPGSLTVTQILSRSSNVGAVTVACKLGKEKFYDYMKKFGFCEITGIDLPGEAHSLIPYTQDWSDTSIATMAFGQGVSITPIQLITFFSALTNNGVRNQPHLLKEELSQNGKITNFKGKQKTILTEETSSEMRKICENVVEEGTGKNANIEGYLVGGKTGTANKPIEGGRGYAAGKYVASFVGFISNKKNNLVILIVIDEPQQLVYGAQSAAPIFKSVGEFSLQNLRMPPISE